MANIWEKLRDSQPDETAEDRAAEGWGTILNAVNDNGENAAHDYLQNLHSAMAGDEDAKLSLAQDSLGWASGAIDGSAKAREAMKKSPEFSRIVRKWVAGASGEARDALAKTPVPEEVRQEMLRRITADARGIRRQPDTGEVEFKMFRGGPIRGYTSFTTDPRVAKTFRPPHQSTWVPESQIKNLPYMYGNFEATRDGARFTRETSAFKPEREAIIDTISKVKF